VLVASALLVAAFTWHSSPPRGSRSAAPSLSSGGLGLESIDGVAVPGPVKPAFIPSTPVLLPTSEKLARWAFVRFAVPARSEPRMDAHIVAIVSKRTPEGTSNIVLVLGRKTDEAGLLWIHIRLPVLPNKLTAWIPRSALGGYGVVRTHLVVDLERLTATLYRDRREVFRADVGVGQDAWPTPRGQFYIRNKLTGYSSPMYGPLAFGTSARSSVLTDWPAGGYIGIHGTDRPELLPGRVSHGCIRLRNPAILRLAELMPVGTPLTIR
jgi:L,D-transpeptidase catalytic domain